MNPGRHPILGVDKLNVELFYQSTNNVACTDLFSSICVNEVWDDNFLLRSHWWNKFVNGFAADAGVSGWDGWKHEACRLTPGLIFHNRLVQFSLAFFCPWISTYLIQHIQRLVDLVGWPNSYTLSALLAIRMSLLDEAHSSTNTHIEHCSQKWRSDRIDFELVLRLLRSENILHALEYIVRCRDLSCWFGPSFVTSVASLLWLARLW